MHDRAMPSRADLVRPRVGRYGLVVFALALLAGLFVVLGRVARAEVPTGLDVAVQAWVVEHRPRWPGLTALARIVTRFGDSVVATPATLLVAVGLYALRLRGVAAIGRLEPLFWPFVILGGWALGDWLKGVIMRDRPPLMHRLLIEESFSFPSGHSVFAAQFFAMLAILLARLIPRTRGGLRIAAVAACVALALLLALSRVWLGVHYLTDVVGGLMLGATWILAVWVVRIGWIRRREAHDRAGVPEDRDAPAS